METTKETTKDERTRKFRQDFLWGLKHEGAAHDALMEYGALKYLHRVIDLRIQDLEADALAIAKEELLRHGQTNGMLMHEGSMYRVLRLPSFADDHIEYHDCLIVEI